MKRLQLLSAPIYAHGRRFQLAKLGVNIADRTDSLAARSQSPVQHTVGDQAYQAIGGSIAIKRGEAFQRRFKKPRHL